MYCALRPGEVLRTADIARANHVSEHHLTKIAQCLAYFGFVETIRGRAGGITLGRRPEDINLGEVIRITEDNLELVECFNPATNTCPLMAACRFNKILHQALKAFLAVLDGYTLADLVMPGAQLRPLLGIDDVRADDEFDDIMDAGEENFSITAKPTTPAAFKP